MRVQPTHDGTSQITSRALQRRVRRRSLHHHASPRGRAVGRGVAPATGSPHGQWPQIRRNKRLCVIMRLFKDVSAEVMGLKVMCKQ